MYLSSINFIPVLTLPDMFPPNYFWIFCHLTPSPSPQHECSYTCSATASTTYSVPSPHLKLHPPPPPPLRQSVASSVSATLTLALILSARSWRKICLVRPRRNGRAELVWLKFLRVRLRRASTRMRLFLGSFRQNLFHNCWLQWKRFVIVVILYLFQYSVVIVGEGCSEVEWADNSIK